MDIEKVKETKAMEKLFDEVHRDFGLDLSQEFNDELNKPKELIACQLLMEEMESQGATKEELTDILKYIAVVIDAKKYKLDWERAYKELDLDGKIDKYVHTDEPLKADKEEK